MFSQALKGEPAIASDLLEQAIERVKPHLEKNRPIKDRFRALWATAKAARGLAARDVIEAEFVRLTRDCEVTSDMGPHGDRDIDWAVRGLNPFESGPLT